MPCLDLPSAIPYLRLLSQAFVNYLAPLPSVQVLLRTKQAPLPKPHPIPGLSLFLFLSGGLAWLASWALLSPISWGGVHTWPVFGLPCLLK